MGETLAGEIGEIEGDVNTDGCEPNAGIVAWGHLRGSKDAIVTDYIFVPGVGINRRAYRLLFVGFGVFCPIKN